MNFVEFSNSKLKWPLFALLLLCMGLTPAHASVDRMVAITDSHGLGQFGVTLTDWLKSRPDTRYTFYASGGSAPHNWLKTYSTKAAWRESSSYKPTVERRGLRMNVPSLAAIWAAQAKKSPIERRITLIFLGTNLHTDAKISAEHDLPYTKKLIAIAQKNSGRCFWIGPPNMTKPKFDAPANALWQSVIQQAIAEVAVETKKKPCEWISSTDISTYPVGVAEDGVQYKRDGVHYHLPGSKDSVAIHEATAWAESVIAEVERRLAQ